MLHSHRESPPPTAFPFGVSPHHSILFPGGGRSSWMLSISIRAIRVGHSLIDARRPNTLPCILLIKLLKVLPFLHAGTKLRNVDGQSELGNGWKIKTYWFPRSTGRKVTGRDGLLIPRFGCLKVSNKSVDVFLNEMVWTRGQGTKCAWSLWLGSDARVSSSHGNIV